MHSEQIVLTGCGWVTPFAAGTISDVLNAGLRERPTPSAPSARWAVSDDVRKDYPNVPKELKGDHAAFIAAVALEHARSDASLGEGSPDPDRVGMVLGCALAGQSGMMGFATEVRDQSARFVSPIHFPQTVGNYISGALARGYHLRGMHATVASGPASSLNAIVDASSIVANDLADIVYAGGVDALSEELQTGLAEAGAGPAEGACLFVLETADHARARGANVLATVMHTGQNDLDVRVGGKTAIVAGTSDRILGAVAIEEWVGHCLGAWGAACVAAAIGAANGYSIPIRDAVDPGTTTVAQLALDEVSRIDDSPRAIVVAYGDSGRQTVVELAVNISDGV